MADMAIQMHCRHVLESAGERMLAVIQKQSFMQHKLIPIQSDPIS